MKAFCAVMARAVASIAALIAVDTALQSVARAEASQVLEVLARDTSLREPARILGKRGGIVYGQCLNGLSISIFGYKPNGEVFTFATLPPNEAFSSAALTTNGAVYVATANTLSGVGSIFRMDPAGSVDLLLSFTGETGAFPGSIATELVAGNGDDVFGFTTSTGAYANGALFHASADGSYQVTHIFTGGSGARPGSNPNLLRRDLDGTFYGSCRSGGLFSGGTLFRIAPNNDFSSLGNLPPGAGAGGSAEPADLIITPNHEAYGVTLFGGANGNGFVFKVTQASSYTLLADFPDSDGGILTGRTLMLASDGNLYGTSSKSFQFFPFTPGNVFRVTLGGTLTPLFTFTGAGGNAPGFDPGRLVEANGALYGITRGYGFPSLSEGAIVPDTIYRLSQPATYKTLSVLRPKGEFDITVNALPQLIAIDGVPGVSGGPLLVGFTAKGGADARGSDLRIYSDGHVEQSTAFRAGNLPVNGKRSITDGSLLDVKLIEAGTGALLRYGLGKLPETLASFPISTLR